MNIRGTVVRLSILENMEKKFLIVTKYNVVEVKINVVFLELHFTLS